MRRYLGLTLRQAEEELPWWESRMLQEQMFRDKPWINYVVMVEEPEDDEQVGADADSLAELGMTVRQVG